MADTKTTPGSSGQLNPDRGRQRRNRSTLRMGGAGASTGPRRTPRPRTSIAGPRRTTGGASASAPAEETYDQPTALPGSVISPSNDQPPPPSAADFRSGAPPPPRAEDRIPEQAAAPAGIMPPMPPESYRIPEESGPSPIAGQPPMPPESSRIQQGGGVYDKESDKQNNPSASGSAAQKEAEASPSDGMKFHFNKKERKLIENPVTKAKNDADADIEKTRQEQEEKNKKRRFFASKRSKVALTMAGVGAGASILASVALLPTWALSQLHAKVQDAFMDRMNYAMDRISDKIMEKYFKEQIFPSQVACGSRRITSGCYINDPGQGPLRNLYASWKKIRLDKKLLDRYGIELENLNGEISIIKDGEHIGTWGRRTAGSREVAREVLKVTEGKGVRDRWLLRHAINSQYGGKWCLFLCKERDALSDRFSPLKRLKLKIAARIAAKVDARVGAFFICSLIDCSPEALERQTKEAVKKTLADVDQALLKEVGEKLEGKTFTQAIVKDLLTRLTSTEVVTKILFRLGIKQAVTTGAIEGATKAIPIVGWVLLAAQISLAIDTIDEAIVNHKFSNFLYEHNVTAYLEFMSNLTTCRDETQSFKNSMIEDAACFQYVLGFAGSRVYQATNGITPKSKIKCTQPTKLTVQLESDGFGLDDFLNGAFDIVRVPDPNKEPVTLESDSPVLVCPDKFTRKVVELEKLRDNKFMNYMMHLVDGMKQCIGISALGPLGGILENALGISCGSESGFRTSNVLRKILNGINWVGDKVVGLVLDGFLKLADLVPGFAEFADAIQNKAGQLSEAASQKAIGAFSSLVDVLFPLAVNYYPASGSEVFDQLAGGWDAAATRVFGQGVPDQDDEEAIVGMQAGVPSPEALRDLDVAIRDDKLQQLQDKSLFARYFDLSDYNSLASTTLLNFASALPFTGEPLGFKVNPMEMFSNVGTLFGLSRKVSAQGLPLGLLGVDRSTMFGNANYALSLPQIEEIENKIENDEYTDEACAEDQEIYLSDENLRPEVIVNAFTGETFETEVRNLPGGCGSFRTIEKSLRASADPEPDSALVEYYQQTLQASLDPAPTGNVPINPGVAGVDDIGPCAPGTVTSGRPTTIANGLRIQLCSVNGFRVAASISGNLLAMLNAAPASLDLGGGAFRDAAGQIATRKANCGTSFYAIYQMPASQCSPPTAVPGTSMHEQGKAIDFTSNGALIRSRSAPAFVWLSQNAAQYGFFNLPSEPWHWSVNGK